MKFLCIYEWVSGTMDDIQAKSNKFIAERKEDPNRYPKRLNLEDGTIARFTLLSEPTKSMTLYETDDPEQLLAVRDGWLPEITCQFIPLRQNKMQKEEL